MIIILVLLGLCLFMIKLNFGFLANLLLRELIRFKFDNKVYDSFCGTPQEIKYLYQLVDLYDTHLG